MSPVSPVFYSEATVSIGLKNVLRVETSCEAERTKTFHSTLFLGLEGRVDIEFRNEVKTLIHNITENRNRHASGLVQLFPLFLLH